MPILGYSMAIFIGLALYAGLQFVIHFIHNKNTDLYNQQFLFIGLMCFSGAGYLVAELVAHHAHSATLYAQAFKAREMFIITFLIVLPWFIYRYTAVGPRRLVQGLSIYAGVQLIPNIVRPYGGYFSELPEIQLLQLPWGEQLVEHTTSSPNASAILLWSGIAAVMAYSFYACYRQYKNGFRKKAAMLAAAFLVLFGFVIHAILVRAGVLDHVILAHFGTPVLFVVMAIALQQKSREQMKRISSILDYVPAVVYMKDAEGRYLLANSEYESLFAVRQQDILGTTDKKLFDEELAREFQRNDRAVLERKQAIEFEEKARHADGTMHDYKSIKFPLHDSGGNIYAVGGISTDITEQKQQQNRIVQNEIKYRTLFDTAGDGIMLMRGEIFIDCNPKALEIFGCKREDIIGKGPVDHSPAIQANGCATAEMAREKLGAAMSGKPQYFDWLHCRQDGSEFDAEISLNRIELNGEQCLQAIVRDVTARRRNEEALLTIAKGVTAQSGDVFYQKMVLSLCKLFDASHAFIGLLDDDDPGWVNSIAACGSGEIIDNFRYHIEGTPCQNVIGKETCSYPEHVRQLFPEDSLLQEMSVESYIGSPLFGASKMPVGIIVVMDIKPMSGLEQVQPVLEIFAARASAEMERLKAEQHTRTMAYKDYLTGLANRAALHDYVTTVLENTKSDNEFGAMLLIDLDHFKTINDALSHDVGDKVLKLVASRLSEVAKNKAYVARIGGDEFAAVLDGMPGMTEQEYKSYTHKLADEMVLELSKPIHLDKRILYIGASIGVVLFPWQAGNELDVMRRADMALYCAKNSGRGNVQFFESSLQAKADERLQIERWLRNAVENKELEVYYQPQLDISGQVVGAEALLRWHHPRLGCLRPDRFIAIAEETGLIHSIGNWALQDVCHQLQTWRHQGFDFNSHIAVNVSAWQFANPRFVQQVMETMAQYHINSSQIVLELTESALLYDVQESIDKLDKLRKAGIRIALDDFGTGYSSLAYLKDMAMDILKIDKAFIHELTSNIPHPLAETIIAMGQHMNLEVVAEGVETDEQRSILISHGCETFQGYLFATPMARSDFESWYRSSNRLRITS